MKRLSLSVVLLCVVMSAAGVPLPAPSGQLEFSLGPTAGDPINFFWPMAPGAAGYDLFQSTDSGLTYSPIQVTFTNSVVAGPFSPAIYYFAYDYFDASAEHSLLSNPVTITVPGGGGGGAACLSVGGGGGLAPPECSSGSADSVVLMWSAFAGAAQYIVLRSPDNTSFTDLAFTSDTTITVGPLSGPNYLEIAAADADNNRTLITSAVLFIGPDAGATVPEPSTVVLLATGLFALLMRRDSGKANKEVSESQ